MKKCIILANGTPPKKSVIGFLKKSGYITMICADGGANTALKYDFTPDFIIGDLDSIEPATYDYYFDKCEIIQISRQNDTDVEKCLKFAIKQKYENAMLLGGTGDRLDHSFCNLGIALKFFDKIRVSIIHSDSILTVHKGKVLLRTYSEETISLYGFDERTKIISHGLKYPLKNISLPFGKKESTSNIAIGEKVVLEITGGKIFMIRNFELMRKHGLI